MRSGLEISVVLKGNSRHYCSFRFKALSTWYVVNIYPAACRRRRVKRLGPSVRSSVHCLSTQKSGYVAISRVKRLLNMTVTLKTVKMSGCVPDSRQRGSIRCISSSFVFNATPILVCCLKIFSDTILLNSKTCKLLKVDSIHNSHRLSLRWLAQAPP